LKTKQEIRVWQLTIPKIVRPKEYRNYVPQLVITLLL